MPHLTSNTTVISAILLAGALCDIFEEVVRNGGVVEQGPAMPKRARTALAKLSRLSLEAGICEDLGASIHGVMDMASRPLREWGLPQFKPPFRYADVILVDRDLGVPTEDCRELGERRESEAGLLEELHHENLRAALTHYPPAEQDDAYTAIREFVVRNPAVHEGDLLSFITDGGHIPAAQTIHSFYRRIPQAALHGGKAHLCAYCHGLLWPDRDTRNFPDGRCLIAQCRLANPAPARGAVIEDPSLWRLATTAILAYWVGPGLDEIRIYDALKAAGRKVSLYPMADAADIGVDGLEVGIDVKTYSSPVVLAARLTRNIGRLNVFDTKVIAVPDAHLKYNKDYLRQLKNNYQGEAQLEFWTVSKTIEELIS